MMTKTSTMWGMVRFRHGSTASAADGLNRLSAIGSSPAGYDARGNLATDPTSGKSYTYWPSTDQLWTVSSPWATLAYDPLDRLAMVDSGTDVKFAYDGLDTLAEYDGSDVLQRRFVFGPGMDEPIVQYKGSGTGNRRFMGADERGSIISLTDSSGALLNINRYDEYGKPQSTNSGRFQYTGQKWIGEAGLYDYKYRDYLPHLGIFAQTDPIGYEGGINIYAYVGNDPVNRTDPLGLKTTEWCEWTVPKPSGPAKKRCWTISEPDENPFLGNIRSTVVSFGSSARRQLLKRLQQAAWEKALEIGLKSFCAASSYSFGGDAALLRGIGVRGSAALNYNTATGQVFANVSFSGGIGAGSGVSGGAQAQYESEGSAGNWGSIDSFAAGGRGWLGGSLAYNWLNFVSGRSSRGTGLSGAVGVARGYKGNYVMPLAISLNHGWALGDTDTPCREGKQ